MAEETPATETPAPPSPPALDEAKLAALVSQSASTAMRETLLALQQQQSQSQPAETAAEPDYFEALIDSRTNQRLSNLGLRAESADDRADFYSSDFWAEDVEDYLAADTPEEIKAEKRELRKKIEASFEHLVKQGKGMKREEIAKHAIGEMLVEHKSKYDDRVVKKRKRSEETEMDKARSAVNIGGNTISNFNPQDVHAMDYEKMLEKFGEMRF